MFFKKKSVKCENCRSKIKGKYSFCPYCGSSLANEDKNFKDYGLLGKGEELGMPIEMGFTDRIIGSLVNTLMKSLDKQFSQIDKEFGKVDRAEIRSFPNGIKIKIGPVAQTTQTKKPKEKTFKNQITQEQIDKMSSMPRAQAEAKVKRINDKVIYELNIPGIQSPHDVFISKLESGYEIKAIGNKKVYVNSLPVNLPLQSLSINNNKLFVEFLAYHEL